MRASVCPRRGASARSSRPMSGLDLLSVAERMPTDVVSSLLVLQNKGSNRCGELLALPIAFSDPFRLSSAGRTGSLYRSDRVGSCAEVVSRDMRNCCRLAGREGGEFGRLVQTASRRVCGKRGAASVFHVYVATDPVTGRRDRLPRARVARLLAFEKVQHMLSAHGRPLGKQPVVFVRQAPSSADGDQTRIAHLGQDRHDSILRWLETRVPRPMVLTSTTSQLRPRRSAINEEHPALSDRALLGSG
jgi:hypothetical protein